MLYTPLELWRRGLDQLVKRLGFADDLEIAPPLNSFAPPFQDADSHVTAALNAEGTWDIDGSTTAETESPLASAGPSKEHPSRILKNVRASDYVTPQKYLDGSQVPTYYTFQSNMVANEDLKHGMLPNLEVDRRLTLPTRTHIRFLITATDVLHSWAVPAFNIRIDALPGRIIRHNAFILREGVFYGQCSEMCGNLHSFMPIVVEAVSPEAYAAHARKYYRD